MTQTVLIFAKPPLIGLSKTRLARSLGVAEARRIARWTSAITIREATDPRWTTILYVAPDAALTETYGSLWPSHLQRRSQGTGDLGDRLGKGFAEAPIGPVLFIGADTPDICRAHIWQAFQHLKQCDGVFGPASDGGFWLFGLNKRRRTPPPFSKVRWSGPDAMADVRRNLGRHAQIAELPVLIDIDDADDWMAWRKGWL
ncbi:MAG: DUF2064 domain-containing protein [Pseudomonadota bacterium]